jgi:hypothetical protein
MKLTCVSMFAAALMSVSEVTVTTAARIQPSPASLNQNGFLFEIKSSGGNSVIAIADPSTGGKRETLYPVNIPLPDNTSNEAVFQALVDPEIEKVFAGSNSFLVAVGPPLTGKTHTFYGSPSDSKGLLQLACEKIFDMSNSRSASADFLITLSAFQLQMRSLTDLLNPGPRDTLTIQDHRICGAYLDGIAEMVVTSAKQAYNYIQEARNVQNLLSRRATRGSPHIFIDFRIESRDLSSQIIKTGLYRIAMLAGASDVMWGVDEGLKSLQQALERLGARESPQSIPFREHGLTQLLQPGLGGNAFCTFLALVSQERKAASDTRHNLQILDHAGKITNRTKVNYNTVQMSMTQLRDSIAAARGELDLHRAGQALHDIDTNVLAEIQQLIKELEYVKTRSWKARQAKSKLLENERLNNLRARGLLRAAIHADKEVEVTDASARQKMAEFVAKYASAEEQLQERRANLRKHQETLDRKMGSSPGGLSVALGVPKDEKTKELERAVLEQQRKAADAQRAMAAYQPTYKQHVKGLVAQEAETKKESLLGSSVDQDFSRLLDTFLEIKRDLRNDKTLKKKLDQLRADTAAHNSQKGKETDPAKKEEIDLVQRLNAARESALKTQWEINRLREHYIESVFRHRDEMERFQEHILFIFRSYRSHFEEQKVSSERRYRDLVGNSIRDSLRLTEDNAQLKTRLETSTDLAVAAGI